MAGEYVSETDVLTIGGVQWDSWGFFDWYHANAKSGRITDFTSNVDEQGNTAFTFTLDGIAHSGAIDGSTHLATVDGVLYGSMWVWLSCIDVGWSFQVAPIVDSASGCVVFRVTKNGLTKQFTINIETGICRCGLVNTFALHQIENYFS